MKEKTQELLLTRLVLVLLTKMCRHGMRNSLCLIPYLRPRNSQGCASTPQPFSFSLSLSLRTEDVCRHLYDSGILYVFLQGVELQDGPTVQTCLSGIVNLFELIGACWGFIG